MAYRIVIKGALDNSWSDWLGSVMMTSEAQKDGLTITTLVIEADQPALFGILDRIRDLNLELRSVVNLEG